MEAMVAHRAKARGFTIIELLVVIGIIALLIAILLPALRRVREASKTSACSAHLRQVLVGMTIYAQQNQGRLPYQAVEYRDWSGELAELLKVRGEVFRCPADNEQRRSGFEDLVPRSYAVNSGEFMKVEGYRWPWPKDRHERPGLLHKVPGRIVLVGENNGGGYVSGAAVGIAEAETLGGGAYGVHNRGRAGANAVSAGDNYGFSDGRVEFRRKLDVDQWPADEDNGGNIADPWKWRP